MVRFLLALCTTVFTVVGLACLVAPELSLAPVGVTLDESGLVEVRGMYGGLQLGMAGFLIWCFRNQPRLGLLAGSCTVGGMGVGRLLGALMSGVWGLHALLIVVECGGGLMGAIALWRTR